MGQNSSQIAPDQNLENLWVAGSSQKDTPAPPSSPPLLSSVPATPSASKTPLTAEEREAKRLRREGRAIRRAEKAARKEEKIRRRLGLSPGASLIPGSDTTLVDSPTSTRVAGPYTTLDDYDDLDVIMESPEGQAPTAQMYNLPTDHSKLALLAEKAEAAQLSMYAQQNIDGSVIDPRLSGYEQAEQTNANDPNSDVHTTEALNALNALARASQDQDGQAPQVPAMGAGDDGAGGSKRGGKPKQKRKRKTKQSKNAPPPIEEADDDAVTAAAAAAAAEVVPSADSNHVDGAADEADSTAAATAVVEEQPEGEEGAAPPPKAKRKPKKTSKKRKRVSDGDDEGREQVEQAAAEEQPEEEVEDEINSKVPRPASANAVLPKKRRRKGAAAEEEPRELPASGPLVPQEIERVEKQIEQYRIEHNLTEQDINNMVQNKSRERDAVLDAFWASVYEQLPHRDPRSIRLSTRRRHHNYVNRGTWSEEDDEQLRDLFAEKPNGWTYIGETMKRMPDDCKDRWQNYLSCGESRKIGEWTEREEIALSTAVEECKRKVRDDARAKAKQEGRAFRDDRDWGALISFKVVSEKLGRTRSGLQCRQHWKVMARRDALEEQKRENGGDEMTKAAKKQKLWRQKQAEENYKHMLPGDKYALLNQIQESETHSEEKIPWRMLTASIPDTKWSTMDRKIAWEQMKSAVDEQATLQDHVAALKQYFEDNFADVLEVYYEGPVKGSNEKVKRELRKSQAHEAKEAAKSSGGEPGEGGPAASTNGVSSASRSSKKYKSAELITESDHEGDDIDPDDSMAQAENDDDEENSAEKDAGSDLDEESMMDGPYHVSAARLNAKALAAAGLGQDGAFDDGNGGEQDVEFEREDSIDIEQG